MPKRPSASRVGSIVFSPLAQGLLTNRYLKGVPEGSRAIHSQFLSQQNLTETYLERARALNEIAEGRGQTLAPLSDQEIAAIDPHAAHGTEWL